MDFYKQDILGSRIEPFRDRDRYRDECCEREHDCYERERCCRDRGDYSNVKLSVNTGGVGPLPVLSTTFSEPLQVVDTTINTECMIRPCVLLTFTGIISLPVGISVTLNFQIKRARNDCPVRIGGAYTFSTIATILESEAFSFQYYDTNTEPGVYTYSIELLNNSIIDVTPGLTILNATLSALAVDTFNRRMSDMY